MTGVLEIAAGIVLGGVLLTLLPYIILAVAFVVLWMLEKVGIILYTDGSFETGGRQ